MECPLFGLLKKVEAKQANGTVSIVPWFCECLKEECAWWEPVLGQCSQLAILEELRLLVGALSMLADKMPPAPKENA